MECRIHKICSICKSLCCSFSKLGWVSSRMGSEWDGSRVGWVHSGWRRDFQRWVKTTYFGTGKMFVYLRNLGTTDWVSTSLLVLSLKMLERRVLYTDCEQEFHQGMRPPVGWQCGTHISGRGSQCLMSRWRNYFQDLFVSESVVEKTCLLGL